MIDLNDCLTTLSSVIINENDFSHVMNLSKRNLKQLYELVETNFPKISMETNQISNATRSINPEDHLDTPSPESMLLSVIRGNAGCANNS